MLSDFDLALADYRLAFPDLASLGEDAATWRTEYNTVRETGLSATLVTNTSGDGTSIGSSANFPQKILLAALHARRRELDPTYSAAFEPAPAFTARRLGIPVQLGPGCY